MQGIPMGISRLFQNEAQHHADRILHFCRSFLSPDIHQSYQQRQQAFSALLPDCNEPTITALKEKAYRNSNRQIAVMAGMFAAVYDAHEKMKAQDKGGAIEAVMRIDIHRKLESTQEIFDFSQTALMAMTALRREDGGFYGAAQGAVLEEIGNRYAAFALGIRHIDEERNYKLMKGIDHIYTAMALDGTTLLPPETLQKMHDGGYDLSRKMPLVSDRRLAEMHDAAQKSLLNDIVSITNAQLSVETHAIALRAYESAGKETHADDIARLNMQINVRCDLYDLQKPPVSQAKKPVPPPSLH